MTDYNDKPHVTIKPTTREMQIPTGTKMIGIVGDNESERVDIDIPRWYDGIDLGQKSIYIVVSNDDDQSDQIIPEIKLDNDMLHLTWIVKSKHVSSEGTVYAHILATDTNGFRWQSLDGEYEVKTVNKGPASMPTSQVTAVEQKLIAMDVTIKQAQLAMEAMSPPIIASATGATSVAADSADRPLRGLTVFGRTEQDGVPSEDAPAAFDSVGSKGAVELTLARGMPDTIVIIRQPRHFAGAVGETAQFEVTALGYGLTYQWQWKGSSAWDNTGLEGNKTASLSVPVTESRNGNMYRCVITDENGHTATTQAASLTIGDAAESDDTVDDTQTVAISIADALRGVPALGSDVTYTDAEGQGWIADTIEYDAQAGTAQIVRRVGSVTYDGSADEDWKLDTSGQYALLKIKNDKKSSLAKGLCTHYSGGYLGTTRPDTGFSANNSSYMLFRPTDYETITLDAWRARLNASPVTVLYALAVPVVEEMSEDALAALAALRSRYPATTVLSDAGAWLEARYVADTKNYVDQRIEQLTNALVSTGANI